MTAAEPDLPVWSRSGRCQPAARPFTGVAAALAGPRRGARAADDHTGLAGGITGEVQTHAIHPEDRRDDERHDQGQHEGEG